MRCAQSLAIIVCTALTASSEEESILHTDSLSSTRDLATSLPVHDSAQPVLPGFGELLASAAGDPSPPHHKKKHLAFVSSRQGSGSHVDSGAASQFRYVGRYSSDHGGHPRFDMNGFQIQFSVEGATEVSVMLKQMISGPDGWYAGAGKGSALWEKRQSQLGILLQKEGYTSATRMEEPGSQPHNFLVYVDGEPQMHPDKDSLCWGCTFDTSAASNETSRQYTIATGLSKGRHEIGIFHASDPEWSSREPTPNWVTFEGVALDAGRILAPSAPRPKRRLEFIGDSSMSGYCNLCQKPTESPERQGSFAVAWPSLLCDKLEAECHSLSWAGFGVHQNCCGNNREMMPDIWNRALATEEGSEWDTDSWKPHGIVLNIGTNDHIGMKDGAEPGAFTDDYLAFVRKIGDAYGPKLHLFLACGPIGASKASCPLIEEVAKKAKKEGIHAHYLDHQNFLNGTFGQPCCGHPSVQNGLAMADAAGELITRALGWHSAL